MTTPVPPEAITVPYVNHRGEKAIRRIRPRRIWFGSTSWHPKPQWLVDAVDLDKDADRSFALDGMLAAARAEGAAAEHDRCIRLITGKRDEFADHARQARALPKTAETLALRADTLSEIIGLLRGKP